MKHSCHFNSNLLKAIFCLALVFSICGLVSCDSDSSVEEKTELPEDEKPIDDRDAIDIDPSDRTRPYQAEPIVLALTEKVNTDNAFAFDLFKATYGSTDDANIFISPLSVNMALSMVLNGAKGATLEEMKYVMEATSYSLDDINKYNKSLQDALMNVDTTTTLTMANSIWYHNAQVVKDEFLLVNKDCYNAEVAALDFNSSDAVNEINNWVSNQTNNKIPEIIKELSAESKMCLINTIYFEGVWRSKFDKSNTKEEDFYSEGGASVSKVNMMNQTSHYPYSEDKNCKYLKMSYGNWAFSMIVMLPNDGKTVDDVISNLNTESWNNAMIMNAYEVNLRFPRFRVESSYEMQDAILPQMGMTVPFTDHADFSGITGDLSFKISRVIHKTVIDVNEDGTKAAAATAVVGGEMDTPPGTIIDYVVNKPFAFAIRENSTGIILFMGKIGHVK